MEGGGMVYSGTTLQVRTAGTAGVWSGGAPPSR
jgi:hypothetical protein